MSLDASARRIAGPKGAHLRSKVGGLYPKTPAPKVQRAKKPNSGLHSDEDSESEEEEEALYDEALAPYLAGLGDLQTSASMLYDDEVSAQGALCAIACACLKPRTPVAETNLFISKRVVGMLYGVEVCGEGTLGLQLVHVSSHRLLPAVLLMLKQPGGQSCSCKYPGERCTTLIAGRVACIVLQVAKALSGAMKQHLGLSTGSQTVSPPTAAEQADGTFKVNVAALKPQHGVVPASPGAQQ